MATDRAAVIKIFMERDGMSKKEANDYLEECLDAVEEDVECGYDGEQTWEDMAGLEPDYLLDCIMDRM